MPAPRVKASVLVWLSALAVGTAQSPARPPAPAGDAAISGVVIDATTKEPIADAVVSLGVLSGPRDLNQTSARQFTDAHGRFVFAGLAPGTGYTIAAAKAGYFDGRYGAGSYLPIAVIDGEWFRNANVTLGRPGSVSGRVIDERGEPAIGVYVRVIGVVRVAGHDRHAVGPLTTTDDRGMYRVGRLAPGRYLAMVPSIRASVPAATSEAVLQGISPQQLDAARAAGRTIAIRPGAPLVDADDTTRVTVGAYPIPPPSAGGHALTYPISFSGGSTLAEATAVTLEPGAELTGVDVRLDPVPAVRIAGVVQGPREAVAGASLRLLADGAEDLGSGGEAGTALAGPDGSFAFAGVPAGTYTVVVGPQIGEYTTSSSSLSFFYGAQMPWAPGMSGLSTMGTALDGPEGLGFSSASLSGRNYWGRKVVTVGAGGISDVVVTLRPAMSISGRLVAEPDPSQPPPSDAPRSVYLEPATGDPGLGVPRSIFNRTAPAGEFVIDAVLPGQYDLRGDSTTWRITSVIANGRDYTYAPLDTSGGESIAGVVVTFTNARTALSGVATGDTGAPVADATVVVFPVEPEQWTNYGLSPPRIKSTRTPDTGAYRFRYLPAGDYYLVAVPASQGAMWRESGFFERARGVATRVSIGWGDDITTAVRLTPLK